MPATQLLYCNEPPAAHYEALFLDLDGVCYLGAQPAPHAPEGLEKAKSLGAKTVYITNNSSRTPRTVAAHLSRIGIPTAEEEVVNSALTTAKQLGEYLPAGARVLVIGGAGVQEAVAEAGYETVSDADTDPVAVVQGLAENVGWAELSEAVLAIKKGALYLATNLDATLPKERGEMIGNGSLVAAVVNATGKTPVSAGKPDRYIYNYAKIHSGFENVLAVGDRLNTDIAGAVNAGIPALHVLTGVSRARDVLLAEPGERPNFLALDLSDLARPMPRVFKDGDVWRCAGHCAAVTQGTVVTDGSAMPGVILPNSYRAAAAAVWEYLDNGGKRENLRLPAQITVVRGE